MSPAASRTTSPGTRAVDGRRCLQPPRRTVTSLVTERARASRAFSARPSWMKPIAALISVTPKITPESTHSPRIAVTTPASSSTTTSGWTNCRAKRSNGPLPGLGVIRFSPCCARRLATSSSASPSSKLAVRRVAASSAGRQCQAVGWADSSLILFPRMPAQTPGPRGIPEAVTVDNRTACIHGRFSPESDGRPRVLHYSISSRATIRQLNSSEADCRYRAAQRGAGKSRRPDRGCLKSP